MTEHKPVERLYEVKGDVVHKKPVKTKMEDGRTRIEVGFPVCTASAYVDADSIAEILEENDRRQSLLSEYESVKRERDEAQAEAKRLREALEEGRRAIGDHFAPNDCYATGPLTGNSIRDLIECPACSFIGKYEAVMVPAALEVK